MNLSILPQGQCEQWLAKFKSLLNDERKKIKVNSREYFQKDDRLDDSSKIWVWQVIKNFLLSLGLL